MKHLPNIFLAAATLLFMLMVASGTTRLWKRHTLAPRYRLENGNAEERQWALREMAKRGASTRELRLVTQALADPEIGVQLVAVAAIVRARPADAAQRLLPCLQPDRPLSLRLRTLEALADLGSDQAWPAVRAALTTTEPELRALAIRLIGRYSIPGAMDLLKPRLADPVESVRNAAFAALDALMPPPPAGAVAATLAQADHLVWEAERATGIKPNFEIGPADDEKSRLAELAAANPYWVNVADYSGTGWLECLEGGGGNHEWLGGEGGSVDVGEAHYPIVVPRTGRYRLWARMWFTDKCGDSYYAWFDHGPKRLMDHPYHDVPQTEWRHWFWLADYQEPVTLEAGVHTLHIQVREDGVRLDQFCLLLDGAAPPVGQAPLPVNFDPLTLASDGADLSVYCQSTVVPEDGRGLITVSVRRLGTASLDGVLEVSVPNATLAAMPRTINTGLAVDPATLVGPPAAAPLRLPVHLRGPERVFAQDVSLQFAADTACREYVLTARFLPAGGGTPQQARRLLVKPWPWEIAGPLATPQNLPELLGNPETKWQALASSHLYDRHGSMDFRKPFGKDARGRVVLRSRLHCDTEAEYQWLLNSDDNATVWLDGQPVIANPRNAPAEGFLTRTRVRLTAGEHTLVAAVQQADFEEGDIYTSSQNQWKFRLRIRRDDHQPAPIAGLPWGAAAPATPAVPAGTSY